MIRFLTAKKITEIVSGARSSKSICVLHDKGKHFVNSLPTCHINLHSLLLTRHKLTDFSSASHRRQLHYSARAAVSRALGFTFWRDISSVALIIFCQPESYAKVSFSPFIRQTPRLLLRKRDHTAYRTDIICYHILDSIRYSFWRAGEEHD